MQNHVKFLPTFFALFPLFLIWINDGTALNDERYKNKEGDREDKNEGIKMETKCRERERREIISFSSDFRLYLSGSSFLPRIGLMEVRSILLEREGVLRRRL